MREFPLKFPHHFTTVTLDMLNSAYGDHGRTFKHEGEAIEYQEKHPGSYLCRLVDYSPGDVEREFHLTGKFKGMAIRPGAKPHCIGWLVTHGVKREPVIRRRA